MHNSIEISVDPELAQVYKHASIEDQQKLQILVTLWLRDMGSSNSVSLGHIMDDISDNAAQRGLTPDLPQALLNDE